MNRGKQNLVIHMSWNKGNTVGHKGNSTNIIAEHKSRGNHMCQNNKLDKNIE